MTHSTAKVPRHMHHCHHRTLFVSVYRMQLSINANVQSSAEVSRELVQ